MSLNLLWGGNSVHWLKVEKQYPICMFLFNSLFCSRLFLRSYPYSLSFIIYLSGVLCLCVCVCVCVSQFVSERSAILLVLAIKLIKETRRRVGRGRDRDGDIWKGTDPRGRVFRYFSLFSLNWEACRSTVPPAVALMNQISSSILWRIFSQTGIFAGFSL